MTRLALLVLLLTACQAADMTSPPPTMNADVYFPRFDGSAWREVAREHHSADDMHACSFDFVDYVRA